MSEGKRLKIGTDEAEFARIQKFAMRAQHELWNSCCTHTRSSMRYFGELFSLRCAPDLLALALFPEAKELTESFATFNAVRNYLDFDMKDPGVTLIAVGDGSTPRTAATFAFRTEWQCISVDPILRSTEPFNVVRLQKHKKRIEEVTIEANKVLIVAVHSHANLTAAVSSVKAKEITVVAMPCCIPQVLKQPWDLSYVDDGILSPAKTIYIWKRLGELCPS